MKTFRWTVPSPALTSREKKGRKALKGGALESSLPEINYEPEGWWERRALERIKESEKWSPIYPTVFLALFYTFVFPTPREDRIFLVLFWCFIAYQIFEVLSQRALHRVLLKIDRKSDPDGVVNDEAAPHRD